MAWIALCQIRDIKRTRKRQESPFFQLGSLQIRRPGWRNPQGSDVPVFDWPEGDGDVPEDYADDSPVVLRVLNKGGEARMTRVQSLTDLSVQVGESDRIIGDDPLEIYYPYSKSRRDKVETFRISYETVSGERGEQVFEHRHGRSDFRRIRVE
jgi:hypothetical protein